MRTETYRPRVQNGPVAKRRGRPASRKNADRVSRRGSGRKRKEAPEARQGSFLLWALVGIGAVIAAGFVFALRSQNVIHQFGQAETQLKVELDEVADRQRFETLERQRALNPRLIEYPAKQAGLVQPRFNRLVQANQAKPPAAAAKVQANPRPMATQGGKGGREGESSRQLARAQQRR